MPTISSFLGIKIYMYSDDHNPPHFHAVYNEDEAVIDIRTLSVREGNLKPRIVGLVLERATLHQVELMENRNRIEHKQVLQKIEPLI